MREKIEQLLKEHSHDRAITEILKLVVKPDVIKSVCDCPKMMRTYEEMAFMKCRKCGGII